MGLEAVLEEIRDKGKKEADAIRAESQQDADRILAEANRKVAGIKGDAEDASAKQATRIPGDLGSKPFCQT
jgi:V/A-type H+-transporting ATPase subunit E